MKHIILASSSPRRKKLLEQVGLKVKVEPSKYEEKLNPRLKPKGQAEFLAKEKAQAVAEKYKDQDVLILGADEVIAFQGETLGKPKSKDDAIRMLSRMSGEMHKAITAFTLIDTRNNRVVTKSVETTVFMKKLSRKEVEGYVATGEPLDRAGSYAIEGKGAVLIDRIDGDYTNIVGLPLGAVVEELKRFGITIF